MLIKKMQKENWETRETSITTAGGGFVGYAKNRTQAVMMAAGPKLLRLLLEKCGENREIMEQIECIFRSVK